MKLPRRRVLQLAAGAAALPAASRLAVAETYPAHPITMVVPFPAGGPTDTLARILADRMTSSHGQSIVIENVSGASGSVGLGRVARARRLYAHYRALGDPCRDWGDHETALRCVE
jgi:tripartite-type tricarboxylate transporter receptor subunit TctC